MENLFRIYTLNAQNEKTQFMGVFADHILHEQNEFHKEFDRIRFLTKEGICVCNLWLNDIHVHSVEHYENSVNKIDYLNVV